MYEKLPQLFFLEYSKSEMQNDYTDFHSKAKKKIEQSNLKKDRGPNKHFSKEDMQMANGHRKRCSTSLTNREIKIKTEMRY